jgi:hypothetical protein
MLQISFKIPLPFDLPGSESVYGSTDGIEISGSPSVAENNKFQEFPLRPSEGIKFEPLLFKKTPIFLKLRIDVKVSQHKAKNNILFFQWRIRTFFHPTQLIASTRGATTSRGESRTLEDKNSRDSVTLKGKLSKHAPSQFSSIYHRLSRGQEDKI